MGFARSATVSRFKLAAISDGFSQDFEKALKIMKGYGLSWVEIRGLWGKYNTEATPEEIKRVKGLLDQYNFKCSVVDSGFYKCVLPGTNAVSIEGGYHTPYSGQMDLLKRAMDRCHAWGTDKVRNLHILAGGPTGHDLPPNFRGTRQSRRCG